jgi:hypothetical protein
MRGSQAVARGDLTQKVQVRVQGHDLTEFKEIINGMVETLSVFADEVSRVAREVGTDGYAFPPLSLPFHPEQRLMWAPVGDWERKL